MTDFFINELIKRLESLGEESKDVILYLNNLVGRHYTSFEDILVGYTFACRDERDHLGFYLKAEDMNDNIHVISFDCNVLSCELFDDKKVYDENKYSLFPQPTYLEDRLNEIYYLEILLGKSSGITNEVLQEIKERIEKKVEEHWKEVDLTTLNKGALFHIDSRLYRIVEKDGKKLMLSVDGYLSNIEKSIQKIYIL